MLHFKIVYIVVAATACLLNKLTMSLCVSTLELDPELDVEVIPALQHNRAEIEGSPSGSTLSTHQKRDPKLRRSTVLDFKEDRHLKPKSSAKKSKKESKGSATTNFRTSSKRSGNRAAPPMVRPPAPLVENSKLMCNGNCILPTGAVLSALLNLDDAISGIVPATTNSPTNMTRPAGRSLTQAENLRRRLHDSIALLASFDGKITLTEGRVATTSQYARSSGRRGHRRHIRRPPTPQLPIVHFTYVMDVSGSVFDTTKDKNEGCSGAGRISDCEKDAVQSLNAKLAISHFVKNVAIIVFSDEAHSHAHEFADGTRIASPSDPQVNRTIANLDHMEGGTYFLAGLTEASSSVQKALQDPSIAGTFVVFITDGKDTSYSNYDELVEKFVAMGTRVHTFAIGNGSNCTDELHDLSVKTRAGPCRFLEDPSTLKSEIDKVFFAARSLRSINVTLDSSEVPIGSWKTIPADTGLLPKDGPLEFTNAQQGLQVTFNATNFIHELCVIATTNVSSDANASCCVNFTLDAFLNA